MKIQALSSYIRRKDMDAVLNCLVTDQLASGDLYDRFIKTAKERLRFDFGLALRSPGLALSLALECLDLPPDSAVALSALSEPWVLQVLQDRGLRPLWLDVDPASAGPSADALASLSEARALYLAHPWGVMVNPDWLRDCGLPIIEDISTALGAFHLLAPSESGQEAADPVPRAAGSLGVFTILGLEHAQSVTGGGGALLYAGSRRDAQVLRNVADSRLSLDRLGEMNAALALAQFKDADKFLEKRSELFKLYEQSLLRTHRKCLAQHGEGSSAFYGCVVVLDTAIKDVRAYARKKDVETVLAFEDSCVARGLVPEGACPQAASLANRALAFPLHPRLGKTAAQKISKVLATLP